MSNEYCKLCGSKIPTKKRLIKLIKSYKKPHNILFYSNRLGIKYKSVYEHIKKLEKAKIIYINQKNTSKGKENLIMLHKVEKVK